jgi:carbon storage regulator
MLVLSRKVGEVIRIDGGKALTVLEINGHRVRLGISAPANVFIQREELCFDPIDGAEFGKAPYESNRDSMVSGARKSR